MTLEQIKTLIVGTIKKAFANKSVLDKLSISNNGHLLFNDKQIAGTGVLYRDDAVLFEGNINSIGTITLPDSIHNYDEFVVYGYQPNNNRQYDRRVYSTSQIHTNYDEINNFYITNTNGSQYIYYSFADEKTFRIDGVEKYAITKIIGIKYKAKQSYSLEEQIVGAWIDGKPLYQKTIKERMPQVETNGVSANAVIDVSDLSIDNVFEISGSITDGSSISTSVNYNNLNDEVGVFVWYQENALHVRSNHVSINNRIHYITIRYTKTTDAPTITI